MKFTKMLNSPALPLFVISSLLLIEACVTPPPDVPVFEPYVQRLSKDPKTDHMILLPSPLCMKNIDEFECGHGVFIMSGKEVWVGEKPEHFYNKKPWSQLKRESIYVPAIESYAPMVQYMINSCKKMNCNDDVDRYKVQADQLKGIGAVLNPGH